jgi:hypothetical protein
VKKWASAPGKSLKASVFPGRHQANPFFRGKGCGREETQAGEIKYINISIPVPYFPYFLFLHSFSDEITKSKNSGLKNHRFLDSG